LSLLTSLSVNGATLTLGGAFAPSRIETVTACSRFSLALGNESGVLMDALLQNPEVIDGFSGIPFPVSSAITLTDSSLALYGQGRIVIVGEATANAVRQHAGLTIGDVRCLQKVGSRLFFSSADGFGEFDPDSGELLSHAGAIAAFTFRPKKIVPWRAPGSTEAVLSEDGTLYKVSRGSAEPPEKIAADVEDVIAGDSGILYLSRGMVFSGDGSIVASGVGKARTVSFGAGLAFRSLNQMLSPQYGAVSFPEDSEAIGYSNGLVFTRNPAGAQGKAEGREAVVSRGSGQPVDMVSFGDSLRFLLPDGSLASVEDGSEAANHVAEPTAVFPRATSTFGMVGHSLGYYLSEKDVLLTPPLPEAPAFALFVKSSNSRRVSCYAVCSSFWQWSDAGDWVLVPTAEEFYGSLLKNAYSLSPEGTTFAARACADAAAKYGTPRAFVADGRPPRQILCITPSCIVPLFAFSDERREIPAPEGETWLGGFSNGGSSTLYTDRALYDLDGYVLREVYRPGLMGKLISAAPRTFDTVVLYEGGWTAIPTGLRVSLIPAADRVTASIVYAGVYGGVRLAPPVLLDGGEERPVRGDYSDFSWQTTTEIAFPDAVKGLSPMLRCSLVFGKYRLNFLREPLPAVVDWETAAGASLANQRPPDLSPRPAPLDFAARCGIGGSGGGVMISTDRLSETLELPGCRVRLLPFHSAGARTDIRLGRARIVATPINEGWIAAGEPFEISLNAEGSRLIEFEVDIPRSLYFLLPRLAPEEIAIAVLGDNGPEPLPTIFLPLSDRLRCVIPPGTWRGKHTIALAASLPAPDNSDRMRLLGGDSVFFHSMQGVGMLRLSIADEALLTIWKNDEFVFGCSAASAKEGVAWNESGRTAGELWGTPPMDLADSAFRLAGVVSAPERQRGLVMADINIPDVKGAVFDIYRKPVSVFTDDCVFFAVAGNVDRRLVFPQVDFRFRRSTGEPVRWTNGVLVAPSSPCEIAYEGTLAGKRFTGNLKVVRRPAGNPVRYSAGNGKWSVMLDPVAGICSRESFGPGHGSPMARMYGLMAEMNLGAMYPYFYSVEP